MALKLIPGTLDDARAWIGRSLPPRTGVDAATIADFRRKLEVQGVDIPIHTDPGVARAHGYRDAVAPVSMLRPISTRAYWTVGDPLSLEPYVPGPPVFEFVPGPGDRVIVTGVDTRYHEPVYPGDRIVSVSTITDVQPKSTSIGEGIFLWVETRYAKEASDALCAVEMLSFFRYTPRAGHDRAD
ncbi:FAS1-like dehydratase domain-containing protein [Sphingomonas sp.]|uniref:FAS1-like dehydratase domain-containing protein n=1 Tax=Sphingomonas sp. TaxID=28214 RepID=UPI002DD69BFC|nr:MaoC family dehydratase N-terminal domain-containing protein [Sphingomonas sp.]